MPRCLDCARHDRIHPRGLPVEGLKLTGALEGKNAGQHDEKIVKTDSKRPENGQNQAKNSIFGSFPLERVGE